MHKKQLETILCQVRKARLASDFAGLFTSDVRRATHDHRLTKIAKPLDLAVTLLEQEIARCDRKINKRREKDAASKHMREAVSRLPYKDN